MILRMHLLVLFCGLFFLASCATSPPSTYVPGQRGEYVTASWYGKKFHGRPTSSGERYNMYGFSAAHKTMKFGTQLRVTNPDNGKSVDITVNDRGPFIRGRDLDLSYGAAKEINFTDKGVGTVRIEYLGRDMRYVKRVPFAPSFMPGHLTIQVGSFTEQSNASRLKMGLEIQYSDVYITSVYVRGQKYHRVRVGSFKDYETAYQVAERLADEGYDVFIDSQ